MKKAWIENDCIRDVCTGNPDELFHADVAKLYDTIVPDEAQNGDGWVNGQPVKPEPVQPVEPNPFTPPIPLIGPIAFQMLFTVEELVAIDAAKDTNAAIRIFLKLIDDPRTDVVDRNIPTVQDAIRHLEAVGCIGKGRADELINAATC